jgi:signal peptidase
VARILKGTIAVLSPQGKLKQEIQLQGKEPTNLAFGGNDGKTVFVTQRKGGFIESFRTDRPGRETCLRGCALPR